MTSAIIACNNQQHMLTHHHNSKRHHHTSHHRGNHARNWETTQYGGNPLLGDGCVPLSEERYLLPTATSHGRLPQQQYINSYSREGVRHQRDSWSSTRDEADLEVQRLTNSHCDGIMVQKGHTTTHQQEHDSQRDSAFYQSLPDVTKSSSTSSNKNYSSPSSGCSPEMSGDDRCGVLPPPSEFKSSCHCRHGGEQVYEDIGGNYMI